MFVCMYEVCAFMYCIEYMNVCMKHVHLCTVVHVCIYVCMYEVCALYVCLYVCMYVCMHVCMLIGSR